MPADQPETLASLLLQTPDLAAERLAELRRLFPDLFDGEGKLKPDEFKQLAGETVHTREHYEFTWNGKRHAKANAYRPATATLTFDETHSVNPEQSGGNLIIEGENLESLKCLLAAYRESVKCIYIDPPYNTGKDFVYSDDYSESRKAYWEDSGQMENGVKLDTNPETAGRYHSNWLSMMYPRLLLARQLLRDDGAIFVSIDDHEVHNLRRLMDDVFGDDCFAALITVLCNPKGRSQDKYFATNNEYVLVYSKLPLEKGAFAIQKDEAQIESEYPEVDEDGEKYRLLELRNTHREFGKHNRRNLYYPFYVNGEGDVSLQSSDGYEKVLPNWEDGFEGCWTWDAKKAADDIDYLVARSVNEHWKIFRMSYARGAERMLKTILVDKSFYTEKGQKAFNEIFSSKERIFQSPKSPFLLTELLKTRTADDDLIVDFFGGSGATAQAVLDLNTQDGGNRKFILVQIPEQTPENSEARKAGYGKISDITIERVKRVIQGYGDDPKPLDVGFRVFRLTQSHFPRAGFAPDPDKTEAENVAALKAYIAEKETQLTGLFEPKDIIDEVLLKNRFKLHYALSDATEFTANKVWSADDGEKQTLLCLDLKLQPETVGALLKTPQAFICLERALDTADKWNLRNHLGHLFTAF